MPISNSCPTNSRQLALRAEINLASQVAERAGDDAAIFLNPWLLDTIETPLSLPTSLGSPLSAIEIRGARVHNLQSVDVDIPRDKITVITGVSGSGKSSLAFDTLYAEGQRQYIDSLSAYARQFLDQIPRP